MPRSPACPRGRVLPISDAAAACVALPALPAVPALPRGPGPVVVAPGAIFLAAGQPRVAGPVRRPSVLPGRSPLP
eukprot:3750279-Heterocapsa_arctica.AAC.1